MSIEIVAVREFSATTPVADVVASTESQTVIFNDGVEVLPVGVLAVTMCAAAVLVRKAINSDRGWSDSIRDFFSDRQR